MKMVMKLQTISLKNKKNKALICLLVFLITALTFPALDAYAAPIDMEGMTSESMVLVDSNSGQVLLEKNKDIQSYSIGSAKLMTALLALEKLKMDDTVVIDSNSAYVGGNNIYLRLGEEIKVKDLLYASLLESANDAATALAFEVSESADEFIEMMNEKAAELGAENTQFMNVTGETYGSDYTTVYDSALIACELMKNDTLKEIVASSDYNIPATNMSAERNLTNKNSLLAQEGDFSYKGANGVYWAYTSQAGPALIGSAEKGGLELIVSLTHGNESSVYEDAIALLDYGLENYESKILVAKNDFTDETAIKTDNGEKTLKTKATADIRGTVLKDGSEIEIKTEYKDNLQLPIDKGAIVGSVVVFSSSQEIGRAPLESVKDVKEFKIGLPEGFGGIAKKILYGGLAIVVLILLYFSLLKVVHSYKRRKNGLFGGSPRKQHEIKRFKKIK